MLQRCNYYCDTTSAARMLLLLQCDRHLPCRDVTANGPLRRSHCQHFKDARAITFSPLPTLQRCCYCNSTFTNTTIMTPQLPPTQLAFYYYMMSPCHHQFCYLLLLLTAAIAIIVAPLQLAC